MPAFKGRTVLELGRRVKTFLSANLPQREQTQELRQAQERIKTQARRIKRLRETLEKERQAASNERARDYLRGTTFGSLIEAGRFGELPEAVRDAALNLRNEIEIARLSEESAERFEARKINLLKVLPDLEPGTETIVDHINYGVYQRGEHKYIYDQEKIMLLLRRIGYSSVTESEYREGVDPDSGVRRAYSFYVEAVK